MAIATVCRSNGQRSARYTGASVSRRRAGRRRVYRNWLSGRGQRVAPAWHRALVNYSAAVFTRTADQYCAAASAGAFCDGSFGEVPSVTVGATRFSGNVAPLDVVPTREVASVRSSSVGITMRCSGLAALAADRRR
jgi:hypothetical protein